MLRRPLVWVALVALAAALAAYALTSFPSAFPLITIDLTMDRGAALAAAERLAADAGWGPADAREAASFSGDSRVQSFVELEGGGKDAFTAMLESGLYQAYTWQVRLFRPGEPLETRVVFAPDGSPYGFRVRLPETAPGTSVSAAEARTIAETAAAAPPWRVRFGEYRLVEQSQETRPGGRVDHTLVYERPEVRLGEGRYRLRLVVGGDRLTELTRFVKVPEAFDRRYEAMRSTNSAVATGAGVAAGLLYLGGGCLVGLFFLLRGRWVVWRAPALWGVGIALVQLLVSLNRWPLLWMRYDTALGVGSFVVQQGLLMLVEFLGLAALLVVSLTAAESLTRRAFPGQLQLWRLWSPDVAASPQVLGRTLGGYLLVAAFFAYEVLLYSFAQHGLGWWTPSDTLIDPNLLATYLPWLGAVGVSLQAGFWEECMFRAIPLAGAALLGRRFGGRRWWILGALLLQAAIFGGAHATYPAQPAYARMAELIVPAIGFGLLYLVFGLLPAIILHFAYDAVWFALPLIISKAPGVAVDRAILVLLVLTPLWVVLVARARRHTWADAPESARNGAWAPPPPEPAPVDEPATAAAGLGAGATRGLAVLGVAGFGAWLLLSPFRVPQPALELGRGAAVEAAHEKLAQLGIHLGPGWRSFATVDDGPGLGDRYAWQEGGPTIYRELLGGPLAGPSWQVRFARFEGDVAERAEEYRVWVDPHGEVVRLQHRLAESSPGMSLTEAEARDRAREAIRERLGLDPATLTEIAAEPSQLPARRDWSFTFSDPTHWPLADGQARVEVDLAGNEVSDAWRFVHVPEDWERAQRERASLARAVQMLAGLMLILVLGAGVGAAIFRWSRGFFPVRIALTAAAVLAAADLASLANRWPEVSAFFSTAQPFNLQAATFALVGTVSMVVSAAALGLDTGLVRVLLPPVAARRRDLTAGAGLGALIAGITAAATALHSPPLPPTADLGPAGAAWPFLAALLAPVTGVVVGTVLVLLTVLAADRATSGWRRRRSLGIALVIALALLVAGAGRPDSLTAWLGATALTTVVLVAAVLLVIRHAPAIVPLAFGTSKVLGAIRDAAIGGYPGAAAGAIAAAFVAALVAWGMYRLISDHPVNGVAGGESGHLPSMAASPGDGVMTP